MDEPNGDVSSRRKWLKLGLVIAFLHYVSLLLVILLLQFNVALAVIVAVSISIVGGIALVVFVLYIY
ncbi:hypothetical protein [Natrinema gelatinilyticum]|uniref:hypothetical protein n=1 Tax=Natrinema gelatinilyticum TaxID=2961571 RepID=UPI0020C58565|nr:hypothetical protein [Natrinema gelatinilyticum]